MGEQGACLPPAPPAPGAPGALRVPTHTPGPCLHLPLASCSRALGQGVQGAVQAGATPQDPHPATRPPSCRSPTHRAQASHLAASPPGLRLETLGFPSLSVPPEMVRPSVLPSFLVSSTVVTPRNSSANREGVSGQRGANSESPAPGQTKQMLGKQRA